MCGLRLIGDGRSLLRQERGRDAGGAGRGRRVVGVEDRNRLEVPGDGGADFVGGGIVIVTILDAVGAVGNGRGRAGLGEGRGVEEAVVAGPAARVVLLEEERGGVAAEETRPVGTAPREIESVGRHHAVVGGRGGRVDDRGLRLAVEFAGVGIRRAVGELAIRIDVDVAELADKSVYRLELVVHFVERRFDEKIAGTCYSRNAETV